METHSTTRTQLADPIDAVTAALAIADEAWQEIRRSNWVQQQLAEPPSRLPDLSFDESARRATVGAALLRRCDAVEVDRLPPDVRLTLECARFRAAAWAREGDWYWLVFDPTGIGFYGLFAETAYCGGFLLNGVHAMLRSFVFRESADLDRYLALVADYVRVLGQMASRTLGQAERGIYMPRVQMVQAQALLRALRARARAALDVSPDRVATLDATRFRAELERRIVADVEPAYDGLLATFTAEYAARAPEGVGVGQYPGGRDVYEELVRLHTTLALSPQQVHARGLERMADLQAQMARIRVELGFDGDHQAFSRRLADDPAWRASSIAGVEQVFQRYIDRLRPRYAEQFWTEPPVAYGVAPLPDTLHGSMTFGYYDAPRPDRPQGLYLFNGANLLRQPLHTLAALTYHELVPGHHLHLATQTSNTRAHPVRRFSLVNAYNEGWAEYAGTLAGELGMYASPEERYGRLTMDAFLTSRLVVDTGMNVLGWSLERARDYMREFSGMAEAEVLTETVRYSCDIPAQALAYKLGDVEMLGMRARMQRRLGDRFDPRSFHAAVLSAGALPLPVLAAYLERVTDQLAAA